MTLRYVIFVTVVLATAAIIAFYFPRNPTMMRLRDYIDSQLSIYPHPTAIQQPLAAEPKQLSLGRAAFSQGDYRTAAEFIEPLAKQGNASAQDFLGRLYHEGKGVPQDDVEALKWYHLAAEQGDARAQDHLCDMYGNDIPANYVRAYMWCTIASHTFNQEQHYIDAKFTAGKLIRVERQMNPEQIAKAQQLVHDWKPIKRPN